MQNEHPLNKALGYAKAATLVDIADFIMRKGNRKRYVMTGGRPRTTEPYVLANKRQDHADSRQVCAGTKLSRHDLKAVSYHKSSVVE